MDVTSEIDPPPTQSLSRWLKAARAPYLNFLRNLTVQIFIASWAWVTLDKLNLKVWDLANWRSTSTFYFLLAMFFYAVYANATLFFEDAFADLTRWIKTQKARGVVLAPTLIARWGIFIRVLLRDRIVELILALLMFCALQFAYVGVITASIVTAVGYLNQIHTAAAAIKIAPGHP